jgi:hypothetical protein
MNKRWKAAAAAAVGFIFAIVVLMTMARAPQSMAQDLRRHGAGRE